MKRMASGVPPRFGSAWVDFLRAQLVILQAAWRVRRVRIGDLVTKRETPGVAAAAQSGEGAVRNRPPERAWELALALERAAKYGILRPQCLVRSVALQQLLNAAGIPGSVVCVGVRREKSGIESELLAHAWVELHGIVLGDRSDHTGKFARLEGLSMRAFE